MLLVLALAVAVGAAGESSARVDISASANPSWQKHSGKIKPGVPFVLTLNPANSLSCRISVLGPGKRHWRAWTFAAEVGKALRLTFFTRVGATPGRWVFRAGCQLPSKQRVVISTAATVGGTGTGPLVAQGDLRVRKVLLSRGKGAKETGGYPYWDAADVSPSTFDWGYPSPCRFGCSNADYWKTKDGVRYHLVSERGYFYRNCTDYVAWKLESLGISTRLTRGRHNGKDWDDDSSGVTVDAVPELGDAAVWNKGGAGFGHVAFVEEVRQVEGVWEVKVSQYNRGSGAGNYNYSDWIRTGDGMTYVDFNGTGKPLISPTPASKWEGWIVQWDGDGKAQKTAWLVSGGKRYHIPDTATFFCLQRKGHPGPVPLPSGVLDQLKDQLHEPAKCGSGPSPPPAPAPTPPPGGGGDTSAPSAPGGLGVSNVTTSSFRVTWSASSDNVGVTGYDVYLNNSFVATTSVQIADISGQPCGTSHTVGVAARDAAGNVSGRANISASTQACPAPPPAPSASIGLARGPSAPAGYWYAITFSNFPPNSDVTASCHDSVDPQGFRTFTIRTNGSGGYYTQGQCYSGDGPSHWVRSGGVESNRVNW